MVDGHQRGDGPKGNVPGQLYPTDLNPEQLVIFYMGWRSYPFEQPYPLKTCFPPYTVSFFYKTKPKTQY